MALGRRLTLVCVAVDRHLLATPRWIRWLLLLATVAVIVVESLPNVPRQYVDFSGTALGTIQRFETYGPDSLSDMYGARVILNDWRDMYTRTRTEQTPLEAATWSKEASAPYPPVVLLAEAGLYAIGERTGIGFYGMILGCAIVFLALSLVYFVRTRWYLFPLLYLNFDYFSERFVHVQDNTYLVMLVVLMVALFLARARLGACHAAMAVAITMKLSPLYYAKNVLWMPRRWAVLFVTIVIAGLVLPIVVWENYLYIYRYANALKGDVVSTIGAAALAAAFGLVVWYVETRRAFDLEDLVGWGLVPFALFLGFKMNVARHLLIVLLVPDKRATRNVAAAAGLAVPALFPDWAAFNASLTVAALVLATGLAWHLREIGMNVVRDDLAHPARTMRMMCGRGQARMKYDGSEVGS